jgi:hypothetical protein
MNGCAVLCCTNPLCRGAVSEQHQTQAQTTPSSSSSFHSSTPSLPTSLRQESIQHLTFIESIPQHRHPHRPHPHPYHPQRTRPHICLPQSRHRQSPSPPAIHTTTTPPAAPASSQPSSSASLSSPSSLPWAAAPSIDNKNDGARQPHGWNDRSAGMRPT